MPRSRLPLATRLVAFLAAAGLVAALAPMAQGQSPEHSVPVDATIHLKGSALDPTGRGLCLVGQALKLTPEATEATWIGPVQAAPFPFTVALPSWNGHAPEATGFRTALRVRCAQDEPWSPWLEVGNWGPALPVRTDLATQSATAWVDIDTLKLLRPATAYQWRVDLARRGPEASSPDLERLSICLSGDAATPEGRAWQAAHPAPDDPPGARVEIPAPFRGQLTPVAELTGRICSPCTVASALGAYGLDRPTEVVAAALYDAEHDLYGVWPRATQGAFSFGVSAYVTRLRSWGELRRHFEAGHVVGASIRFKAGALAHPPYPSTNGHLILLRGFTEAGDVITCDSYRAADGDGKRWPRDDLAIAWFDTGGVAYVFEGPPSADRPFR